MEKHTTQGPVASSPTWERLETWLRSKMREWLQDLLDAEVDELLGRRKSARRKAVDSVRGYRSGHGKPRRLTLSCGTVTVRRPRVRGLQERFESRLLPLFARRTPEVNALLPELYLHGLALGDFDLALRGLLGEDAPLSAATVSRLKEQWHAERAHWARRPLADLEVVYLWVDGVYVKAGLEREKAAVLVVLAALTDGRKELVTLVPGHRESTEAWSEVLRDLRARGLQAPKLVIGDGHLGIWAGLRNVYPDAREQRCWNHRIVNALDKVPKRLQAHARLQLTQIPYADTAQDAEPEGGVPALVPAAGTRGGNHGARPGLGPNAHLLPVPEGPLGTPADEQPHRIALRGPQAADRRGETVQAGGKRDRGHLEDAAGRPAAVPATERPGVDEGGLPRRRIRQRGARP